MDCGGTLDRKGVRCISCNSKRNQEAKETRNFYLSKGMCPDCRIRKVEPNKRRCAECAMKARNAERRHVQKDMEKFQNYNREYQKDYYQKRKTNGICVRCGEKINDGFTTCEKCREKRRKSKRGTTK